MEFESKEQFQKMVREEAQRQAIRESLNKKGSNSLYDQLKHPLFSVLFGFLLTGVAGTLLTNHFQTEDKKRVLQKEAFRHVREFSQALSMRTTESGYLQSAMTRNTNQETLVERKRTYDEAVKVWNTNYTSHLLTFREYSGSRNPIFIERNIENDLVPILRATDLCLTEAFDDSQGQVDKEKPVEASCWVSSDNNYYPVEIKTLNESARICGYEIENLLFSWITINLKYADQAWGDSAPKVMDVISDHCAVPVAAKSSNANKPLNRTAVPLRVAISGER